MVSLYSSRTECGRSGQRHFVRANKRNNSWSPSSVPENTGSNTIHLCPVGTYPCLHARNGPSTSGTYDFFKFGARTSSSSEVYIFPSRRH